MILRKTLQAWAASATVGRVLLVLVLPALVGLVFCVRARLARLLLQSCGLGGAASQDLASKHSYRSNEVGCSSPYQTEGGEILGSRKKVTQLNDNLDTLQGCL